MDDLDKQGILWKILLGALAVASAALVVFAVSKKKTGSVPERQK